MVMGLILNLLGSMAAYLFFCLMNVVSKNLSAILVFCGLFGGRAVRYIHKEKSPLYFCFLLYVLKLWATSGICTYVMVVYVCGYCSYEDP